MKADCCGVDVVEMMILYRNTGCRKKEIGEKTTKLLENRTEMLNRTQEKKIWSCDCAALGSSGVQSTVGSILGLFHCSSLIQTYGIVALSNTLTIVCKFEIALAAHRFLKQI